jgi:hypothetical protein
MRGSCRCCSSARLFGELKGHSFSETALQKLSRARNSYSRTVKYSERTYFWKYAKKSTSHRVWGLGSVWPWAASRGSTPEALLAPRLASLQPVRACRRWRGALDRGSTVSEVADVALDGLPPRRQL